MFTKKVWQLFAILLIAVMILSACAPKATEAPATEEQKEAEVTEAATEAPAEETEAPAKTVKFAVITSGPKDDNSWNEAAWNGAEALKAKGVEVAFSERIAEGDEERILREYADQGFDMIVAHSFGYQDGVFKVAADYPDVNFAWAGGIGHTAKNVGDYDQPFYEPAYLAGIVAGYMSKSGTLGYLAGFDVPVCHAMGQAFLAGARTVNPDVKLISTAAGSWEDVAASKEAALAQADAGVDYWIECGEGPALGAIEAAKETGGYVTGYVGDMSENGPDVVLASIIWNLEPLFTKMIEQTESGTFDNPAYKMGISDGSGSMYLAYNDALKDKIPQEAVDAVDKALQAISSGEFEVPFVPEGELEAAAPATEEPALTGKFAVITSGPKDDNSWNEAAWNGVEALKAKGVEVAFSERIAEGDEERILREYADQGFNMIVAHGFGYQDGVFKVAADYPDINFAWAGGINHTAKNVGDYDQPFYEPAYVAGIVAGYVSKSGTLGYLAGFDVPVCHAMGQAFLAGARTVNPDAKLISTAAGSWEDVAASKEAALAQADAGVDFWIECGEGPALGAIEAAKEVGGYVTGYVGDMSENGPDVVLTSIIWNLEPLFTKMLQQTLDGTFDNPFYKMGISDGSGSMYLAYNEALKDKIPQEAIDAANAAIELIKSGEFEVPFVPEGELSQ